MTLSARDFLPFLTLTFSLFLSTSAQDLRRDLKLGEPASVEIVNQHGRVTVTTAEGRAWLTASSLTGVQDTEIKISNSSISVRPSSAGKRIDLTVVLPRRSRINIVTGAGAIAVGGDQSEIRAVSETGTISVDVPEDEIRYRLMWTESRPRFLADFDLEKVKERSAGRFEISGNHRREKVTSSSRSMPDDQDAPSKKKASDSRVELDLKTARGIILINVPQNEVNSDLRERPLTNAAKAIIRSGDSLLMEAIRRAAPRYFGDYSSTLPPIRTEPTFSEKRNRTAGIEAEVKTALVRATDLKNRSITGLTAADFEVLEDGSPREIVAVEHSQAPFNLVLLLDVSGSVENYVNFIRKAARNFVDTVGSQDRVAIVIFNEDVKLLSTFTTDKGRLSESLDTFDAGGGTAYYDALAYAVSDTLRPLRGERTAIVVLTDGDDNRSFLAFDSLHGSIQESGALIYPLYVPSGLIALGSQNVNADIDPLRKKYMSLTAKSEGEGEKLAQISGGVYYPITQIGQIQKAYEDIVLQMRSAYNITFRSARKNAGDGVSPRIKIRVKKENVFTTVTAVTAGPTN